jgi:hypothetical protein
MDTNTTAKPRDVIRQPSGEYARLNLVVTQDMRDQLDQIALQLERPLSWLARQALREWLNRHHPPRGQEASHGDKAL